MKFPSSTGMQHQFAQVPEANIPRSVFNRSHCYKTTFDAGYLVPFYVDEALPGDTFNLNATLFARMATPIAPFMDNLYLDVFYFAVPIRLIWANFKKFMGEQTNPGDSISYSIPQIVSPASTGWVAGSLSDYFGLPINVPGVSVSALWHRAYNLIFNEWFRDQNLQNSVTVDTGDSASLDSNYTLLRRGKRHDYFTSCLPWPQKGTAVTLPLSGNANVVLNPTTGLYQKILKASDHTGGGSTDYLYHAATTNNLYQGSLGEVVVDPNGTLLADMSTTTAATINALRQAFQLQKLLERDARGGTRYTEIVKAHFGVTSPDARLQRPEYLGGSSTPVGIIPVPQTSSTTGSYPQGHLAAFATAVERSAGFTKSFTEHCVLIGLVNVRADLTYQQGINKMFLRSTRYDYYWPALSCIGEQSVLSKEIYCDGTSDDNNIFGYQERYAEYRYKPSQITGKLRSTYSTPLDVWHLAQKFTSRPTLSATFIVENPPMDRVSAVSSEPHFILDSFIQMSTARPMPVYGVPGLIDHF